MRIRSSRACPSFRNRIFTGFALVLALPPAPVSGAGAQQRDSAAHRATLVARLDSLARDFLTAAPAVGATVAVVKGRDTLLLEGVGLRDRDRRVAADTGTVYRVGSITKQFTAAAVMRLIDSGHLHLDDSLRTLLPQYAQWRTVTLRQLLNHTSGIPSYTASPAWRQKWARDLSPAALVAFVARDTVDFAPGTQWRYDNTGYVLLGMILERVMHVPYADLVQREFFTPLGLHSATYCPSRPRDRAYAKGYDLESGKVKPTAYLSMTQPYAAGALCMSVPDFLRWQAAFTGGVAVPASTYARMTTPDTLPSGASTNYGYGLMPARLGGHREVHHGGDVHGFSADQLWLPDDTLRVVVFTNTLGSNPKFLADNLASAVLGLPLRQKTRLPPSVRLAVRDQAKYTGTYDIVLPNGNVLPLRVFADDDGLVAHGEAPGQGTIRLVYLGADTFGAEFDASLRLSFVFEHGVAVKAHLLQRGMTMEGPRRL